MALYLFLNRTVVETRQSGIADNHAKEMGCFQQNVYVNIITYTLLRIVAAGFSPRMTQHLLQRRLDRRVGGSEGALVA